MMKVLWFECTTPGRYKSGEVLGGWQDSLETIVKDVPEIELTIAFEVSEPQEEKHIDGIHYMPIFLCYTQQEKKQAKVS